MKETEAVKKAIEKRLSEKTGLAGPEQDVMFHLIEAYNKFKDLERTHDAELVEFSQGIHACQALLSVRISRRDYPEGWNSTNET